MRVVLHKGVDDAACKYLIDETHKLQQSILHVRRKLWLRCFCEGYERDRRKMWWRFRAISETVDLFCFPTISMLCTTSTNSHCKWLEIDTYNLFSFNQRIAAWTPSHRVWNMHVFLREAQRGCDYLLRSVSEKEMMLFWARWWVVEIATFKTSISP